MEKNNNNNSRKHISKIGTIADELKESKLVDEIIKNTEYIKLTDSNNKD